MRLPRLSFVGNWKRSETNLEIKVLAAFRIISIPTSFLLPSAHAGVIEVKRYKCIRDFALILNMLQNS